MGEFFKAELKDRFLGYALGRRDYFQVQDLYNEFLRPNYSAKYVVKLIREIQDFDQDLLDIMSGNGTEIFMMASTSATQQFLNQGGFRDMYVKEEEKWDIFLGQLSSDRDVFQNDKRQTKATSTNPKKERNMLMFLIIAIAISFAYTLFTIVNDTLLEPDYVPADEFERKLEQVRLQYSLENERLANMLQSTQQSLDSLKSETNPNH